MADINILETNDFTTAGEFYIGLNNNEATLLSDEITYRERDTLEALLGDKLYNDFQTDLAIINDGTPTAQKWLDFVNGVTYIPQTNTDKTINYKGCKDILKSFVFFYYLRLSHIKRTGAGIKVINGENSEPVGMNLLNSILSDKYNKGVDRYKSALVFLNEYKEYKATASNIVEAAGTYTITINDTKYLAVGDIIKMGTSELTVTIVTADTEITATGTIGLTTENDLVWFPFKDWVKNDIDYLGLL